MTRTEAIAYIKILKGLIAHGEVDILLSTFITAFRNNSFQDEHGVWYLFGNFNLGGTVSGRLSSSKPNLQNIPSTSKYAKVIKKCFKGFNGFLMAGADFNSLEDYISALTTKDPNKLKVYLEGYDGHCLRAYSYFKDQMPDIKNTVESINSIAKKYKPLRQDSKGPTFALTYQGTWHTLVKNLGFSKEKAQQIEAQYHMLYEHSDKWVWNKLEEASKNGYATVAFGLRIRTPILARTILGKDSTPYEAAAEGRTVGNALGQSYGLLNNRAANEMRERILSSPYRLDIRPISQIHDAQYYIIRNRLDVIEWFNINLVECMSWQDLPELEHDKVKLGAATDIYYPSWANDITLPNNATKQEIIEVCNE